MDTRRLDERDGSETDLGGQPGDQPGESTGDSTGDSSGDSSGAHPDVPSSERLEVALDTAGIGSWSLDLASGDFAADARCLVLFGFPADSPETRLSEFARLVPRDERRRVDASLRRSLAGGSAYAEEYRVQQPDGSMRWVAARGRPAYDAAGRFTRLLGCVYDTTDQHLSDARAETTTRLLLLVASAGEALASSLEPEDAVRSLASLMTPTLADWSIVSLVDRLGRLVDVESWHTEPHLRAAAASLARHRLLGRDEAELQAMLDRVPFVVDEDAIGVSRRTMSDPEAWAAVQDLQPAAVAVHPLHAGSGAVIGLITLGRGADRGTFSPEELGAATDVCRRASIALENARSFRREREMSEQLQRSLLSEPVSRPDVEIAVRYLPASQAAQVGGDWYDAFAQADGSTVLVVGDVAGHDSEAAGVMGQLRGMLRGIAVSTGRGPADLLGDLDRMLTGFGMDTFATVVVTRLEPDPGSGDLRLHWSSAGHPPPLLADGGHVRQLELPDAPLGVDLSEPRHEHQVALAPGATLLLYTDGLVERRDEDIDVGIDRLRTALTRVEALPLEEAVDLLVGALTADGHDDDVVVLALRVGPGHSGTLGATGG